jgi:predicted SprT family Zn-dependent metalloprotease
MRQEIKSAINYCLKKANREYKIKVKEPQLIISNRIDGYAGLAIWHKNIIVLSKFYLSLDMDWVMEEIVPHEVAHLIDIRMAHRRKKIVENFHNDQWKEIAMFLGSSGKEIPTFIM